MGKNVLIDPIECLLRKIGKEIFLRILYPEIKKNRNITVEELANILSMLLFPLIPKEQG